MQSRIYFDYRSLRSFPGTVKDICVLNTEGCNESIIEPVKEVDFETMTPGGNFFTMDSQ